MMIQFSQNRYTILIYRRHIIKKLAVPCFSRFYNTLIQKTDAETTAAEIMPMLKQSNWKYLLHSSHIPGKLSPSVVYSVLEKTQSPNSMNPRRLLDFFNYSHQLMGTSPQIELFSIVLLVLCNAKLYGPSNGVIDEMIGLGFSVTSIMSSISRSISESDGVHSNGIVTNF